MALGSLALPPLQGLRAFLAIAESGSFTGAAAALGVTQTAVSHQIAQLETWLGAPVFERGRRAVRLTALGEDLLPKIRNHLLGLHAVLSAARQGDQRRKLVISTTPEFGTQWLAPRLEEFLSINPGIGVSVSLDYRRVDIPAGEADIGLWLGSGGIGVQAERLMLEEEFVVSSPGLASQLPKTSGLLAAPILRYEGARHTVLDWRRWHSQLFGIEAGSGGAELAQAIDFDGGPNFSTFAEMLAACRRGEGFALVRSSLVADDLKTGQLVRCFIETLPSDLHYHLVTAASRRQRPDIASFRQWIFERIAQS